MNRFRIVCLLSCLLFLATVRIAEAQGVLGDAFKRFETLKAELDEKKAAGGKEAGKPNNPKAASNIKPTPVREAKPAVKKVEDDGKAEGEKKLEALYKEVEALLEGQDEFSKIVKKLQQELKDEFRENETKLGEKTDLKKPTQSKEVQKLESRQKVIAQLHIELNNRSGATDSRARYELQRKVSAKFSEFRSKNRQLARTPEFSRKQSELTQKAMRRRAGVGVGGRNNAPTLVDTMRTLSNSKASSTKELASSRVHPGEQEGPIQHLRYSLRSLLKLSWDGQNLALDRSHWDDAFANRTVEDIRVEVDGLLENAGAKGTGESEDAARIRRSNNMQNQSNVDRLFNELRGGGNVGGYARSGSGQDVRRSFTNGSVNARLLTSATRFELMIEEITEPSRVLRITDDEKGLQLVLVGDMVHRFHQNAQTNKLTLVEVVEDEADSFSAQTFAELYRDKPRFVEERFFALLDHVGVIPPASRFDPLIVQRVIEYLGMDRDALKAEVENLVIQLDSDRFTEREAAFAKLRDGIDKFHDLLHSKQADTTLSAEAKARIRKLLAYSKSIGVSHHDSVIATLGLTDNIEYLQEVRTIVEDESRVILDKRIAALLK